ncbi:RNA-binding protein [Lentzea guizhouensis]|uniref:RNA-binding protein n=1 Tax=Lentzea guizhouensis TaxID=1586287 RepID=A0A1B2HML1_9PSEU|nr:S1 RNA-binding domain-containing protein [Lentzea guizhouensis]ANZ38945.1 RNA-binding protein [Lentzea guizhouensis]
MNSPELTGFLAGLERGTTLSGTVAAVERFGVFVALDDGPPHPVFPGVGFISAAELSWRRFDAFTDVVQVGERVTCEFLQFDTTNLEARLSLKATRPDPFQTLTVPGGLIRARVTTVVPFGVFVEVADGLEGLLHQSVAPGPFEVDDEVTVVVTEIDRERHRIHLGLPA